MKLSFYVLLLIILFIFGCDASQIENGTEISNLNSTIIDQKNIIDELNKTISKSNDEAEEMKNTISILNEEIETMKIIISSIEIAEDNKIISSIPKTYEEAVEIMNKLNIQNVVLEHLLINGITYTVVEVKERSIQVGTDDETVIYDIPDKSGNIVLTLPYKNEINATMIAIIDEPSPRDWGVGYEHWVKIEMGNDKIGWVRGEYVNMNIGGIKYKTQKNIWLDDNYFSHGR